MNRRSTEILIVMPVFNEQASLRKVVTEWFSELERYVGKFVILAIDDGSTDETLENLKALQGELGARLEWISRENRGHGQTCIQGYRIALERKIPYIFQIDSDGQCDPQYFIISGNGVSNLTSSMASATDKMDSAEWWQA